MKTKKTKNSKNNNCFYDDAIKYYQNGKSILKSVEIKNDRYQDKKKVKEACGIAYLSALEAINGYLTEKGVAEKDLPTSIEEYRTMLNKYLSRDGKIKDALNTAYENIHIFGYYRDGLDVHMIKSGFEKIKFIIEKLSNRSIT